MASEIVLVGNTFQINKSEFVHWRIIYVLVVCHHQITHRLRYSKRNVNLLMFVRSASCIMIRNEHNTNPFLGIVRQFVNEFSGKQGQWRGQDLQSWV